VQPCVIYARVSTKEQQEEGYSIPAQLKSMRAFCEKEELLPVAEFIEAESAGKAGRSRFGAMLAFFGEHPDVRLVVAHKLDRLYRNFADQVKLEEELGVRARYVLGDMPDSPQGQLLRDVQLSVAKFYLGNLREEVKKGLAEKAAQGGWNGRAPLGYVNDRETHKIVPDPLRAPLVRYAFERYASGLVSLNDLANELHAIGLSHVRSGSKVYASSLHGLLRNPVYTGFVRFKGTLYEGKHEPLVSLELFGEVQQVFEPNRNGNKEQKHVFALRDFLTCGECGCKITAERQRGHVYYRCTHGKGRDLCHEKAYTREELLLEQVESIFRTIELGQDLVAELRKEAEKMDAEDEQGTEEERQALLQAIADNKSRVDRLLDSYLENLIDRDTYQHKARELGEERLGFEQRKARLEQTSKESLTARLDQIVAEAGKARLRFSGASTRQQRDVLAKVLLNATLRQQEIMEFQLKHPFNLLQTDRDGALIAGKWALLDLNKRGKSNPEPVAPFPRQPEPRVTIR
jgi:DNA invertase Pin-like site-specific DNA recombinase